MNIVPASPEQFIQALHMLKANQLPTEDLHSGTQLFVAEKEGNILGTVAVEYDYDHALLRSLSVNPEYRSAGVGSLLVQFIEDYVAEQGVGNVYLLTTTAAEFFKKRNYQVVSRDELPLFILETSEFKSVCPVSATVMKKQIT